MRFPSARLESSGENSFRHLVVNLVAEGMVATAPGGEAVFEQLERLERLQAMAMFAGGVAHDVANLAGAVRLTAQSALRGVVEDEIKGHLEAIERCASVAGDLVGMLLDHTRPSTDAPEPVNITELVEANERTLKMLAGRRVKLRLELQPVPPIAAHAVEILQVLANLVRNASESIGPAGGSIWLRTSFEAGHVIVDVQDDGLGFSPSALERAREPFFTTKPDGYGIGLSLVCRVAASCGATVKIDSSPDRGATLRISFDIDAEY